MVIGDDTDDRAGCVIIFNKKFVVVRGPTNKLSFPKGHVQHGETFHACAKRETMEECGLDVNKFNYLYSFNIGRDLKYFVYKVEEELKLKSISNSEIKEVLLMSLEELNKERLRKKLNFSLSLFVKGALKRESKHKKFYKYDSY